MILHDVYNDFIINPSSEGRGNFLDISKAFDSFLNNRYQRVLLNGQASFWADVKEVVSQESIRSLILFICVNDLSENLKSTVIFFAHDRSIFYVVTYPNTSAKILNHDLNITSGKCN